MRPLVRKALRGSLRDIRHVEAVTPAAARGLVARVYGQAERDFGLVAPPLALHSPAPDTLAAAWALLRETLLVPGRVDRAAKETVATAVSLANRCPYCAEIHQAKLDTLPAADGLGPLADWARAAAGTAGEESRPPFGADEAAEILGVAVTFHYLNRMAGLFLPESPVPPSAPAAVRGPVLRTVARAMRPAAGTTPRPGDSLGLLPAAPLPPALSRAGDNPWVADALARAVAAVDTAGHWIPDEVRELLHTHRAAPGPSRAWLEEALAGTGRAHLPAARLALLVAQAPYQITDTDVDDFRAAHPGDRRLVELASWAALTTAVRIGGRIRLPASRNRARGTRRNAPADDTTPFHRQETRR